MGIKITDVKIVGQCSKHRKQGDEIMKDKTGRIYRDNELSCISCGLGVNEPEKGIFCSLCGGLICKYELDWKSSGAITIEVGEIPYQTPKDICFDCAVKITKEIIEENL